MQISNKTTLVLVSSIMLLSSLPIFTGETPTTVTLTNDQFEKLCSSNKKSSNVIKDFITLTKSAGNNLWAMPFYYKILAAATITPIIAGVYRFNMKSAKDTPARYDTSKLNYSTLKEEPKIFFNHLWYLVDDFIIGRRYGSKEGYKVDRATGKHKKFGYAPQGIGGYLHVNVIISLAKTLGFIKALSSLA